MQYPSSSTNTYGERIYSWTTDSTVWAAIGYEPVTEEKFSGEQYVYPARVNFTVRYNADINATWRVLYCGLYYEILSVQEIDRKRYMLLLCEHKDNRS